MYCIYYTVGKHVQLMCTADVYCIYYTVGRHVQLTCTADMHCIYYTHLYSRNVQKVDTCSLGIWVVDLHTRYVGIVNVYRIMYSVYIALKCVLLWNIG